MLRLPRQFRFRYSLRLVGITVTAVCVWLGMVTSAARRQQSATKQLRSVNATVVYDRRVEELLVPRWIREQVGDDFFLTVVEVRLADHREGRKSLPLPSNEIDIAVDAMRRLPGLRTITFNHTRIGDEDLRQLAPLAAQIESLYFNEFHAPLTGDGLKHLAGWRRLNDLTLLSRNPDCDTLKHLREIPALKSFGWHGALDDAAFGDIAACKSLETLRLFACRFDGESLRQLRTLNNLKTVWLHNCTPKPVGVVTTIHKATGQITVSPPTSYEFQPMSGIDEIFTIDNPEPPYQEWRDGLLPGVNIWEFFSS